MMERILVSVLGGIAAGLICGPEAFVVITILNFVVLSLIDYFEIV